MAIFNETEKQLISEAIARVELKTAGEIVVATIPRSHSYVERRALASALLTVGCAIEIFWQFPQISPWWIFLGQLPFGALVFFLFGWGPILRWMTSDKQLAQEVDARAKQAFVDLGVVETRDRSGVLIFLSELEHRVEILADRGIHERVDAEEWQRDVEQVIQSLRGGAPGAGVVAVIERIGLLLAEKFPVRADDTNELDNRVRELKKR